MLADSLFRTVPAVVAIPVRDEAERIADCLMALAGQTAGAPGVVLLVNNTSDDTMAVVAEVAAGVGMPIHAIEHVFPKSEAHAGSARRMAMAQADALAPVGVPLLTTDADGRAAPDWLAANLFHLRRDIDVVFGCAEIDPIEAASIPPLLHQVDARECAYAAALDEIAHWLDRDEYDPWPRHVEHSGASIAVSRAMFRRSGGIPLVALGEDRAFAAALRRAGARIRHAPEARVVVSGRILGRAVGGMADTIRRRLVTPDPMLDDALGPVEGWLVRLRRRKRAREVFGTDLMALAAAFDQIDVELPRQRVAVAELPGQMDAAQAVLADVRMRVGQILMPDDGSDREERLERAIEQP